MYSKRGSHGKWFSLGFYPALVPGLLWLKHDKLPLYREAPCATAFQVTLYQIFFCVEESRVMETESRGDIKLTGEKKISPVNTEAVRIA